MKQQRKHIERKVILFVDCMYIIFEKLKSLQSKATDMHLIKIWSYLGIKEGSYFKTFESRVNI